MAPTPEERFATALGNHVLDEFRKSGHALIFDDAMLALGREHGIPDHLVGHTVEKLAQRGLLYEKNHGLYDASALALWYEEEFEPAAWRDANRLRRGILEDLAATFENGGPFRTYDERDNAFGDWPIVDVITAVVALQHQGLAHIHHHHNRWVVASIESDGYDLARDEAALNRRLPRTATEDEGAHADVVPDVLRPLITSCDQLLRERGWNSARDDLKRADGEYGDGKWANAVGEYASAVESALKHLLAEHDIKHSAGAALDDLAKAAAARGLIPSNYQAGFRFLASVRSPRRHGRGPDDEELEIGPAEALLMGNHARSLIVYLSHRPGA